MTLRYKQNTGKEVVTFVEEKTLDYIINYTVNMPLAGKQTSLDGKRQKRDIRDYYIFKDKLGT